jgi:hypothetical protein
MAETLTLSETVKSGARLLLKFGGNIFFNVMSEVASVEVVENLSISAATKLGVLYVGYKLLRPVVHRAVKKALGGEQDYQVDIKARSSHVVRFQCFKTDEEVLADYESERVKERFEEEFSKAGIKVEGLRVEIENLGEVNETKEAINNRYMQDVNKKKFNLYFFSCFHTRQTNVATTELIKFARK